jgi:hypothetical protein
MPCRTQIPCRKGFAYLDASRRLLQKSCDCLLRGEVIAPLAHDEWGVCGTGKTWAPSMLSIFMSLTQSIVEEAALTWFGELGYAVGHGPRLTPGEPAAERDSFGAFVFGR